MATLLEYLESVKKQHKVRIKLACGCSNEVLDKIERHLEKYDVEQVTAPQKTILQKRPLDFPQLDQAEVYIIDFTANLPVSMQQLHSELASMLRVPEGLVVVRSPEDPRETQDDSGKTEVTEPLLTTELPATKQEETFGGAFNTNLLKELKAMSDKRKEDLKQTKVTDPDVPATEPEIGDSASTNKTSPVRKFTAPMGKGK
jgi:hypothetical protein